MTFDDNRTLFALHIPVEQITAGELAHIEEFMADTMADKQKTLNRIDRVALTVGGYDDDPRELADIPELRQFFARLNDMLPSFSYFLEPASRMLWLAICCADRHERIGGQLKARFKARETLEFVTKCWTAGNQRIHELGICDDPIIDAQDKAIHDWLKAMIDPQPAKGV